MSKRKPVESVSAHSETAAMIGDRMDTDVRGGPEAGWRRSSCSAASAPGTRADVERFPYRPSRVVESIADLIEEV